MTTIPQDITHKQLIQLLSPVAEQNGYELVEIEITSEYSQRIVRVYIDKEGGITVDDCAKISGYFEDLLDMSETMPGRYVFEVSSPGLNRPLRLPAHYSKVIGQKVQIVTFEKLEGRKNFKGILKEASAQNVTLEIELKDYVVPLDQIQRANVVYSFQ